MKLVTLSLSLEHSQVYQAWADTAAKILLAEADSYIYKNLAKQLNISVTTVRNSLNWYEGVKVTSSKNKI